MSKVFTDNCRKVAYYISGSITHKYLKFLYITTNFQYHSRSFDFRNTSQKKSDIFTPTKHSDCIKLWRIQKSYWFDKGISQAFQIVATSTSSQLRVLQSRVNNRFITSGDVSPPMLPNLPRTKIIEENIDTVTNLIEESSTFPFPF